MIDFTAALGHPANAGLRRHCAARFAEGTMPPLARPDRVEQPYLRLGTHPDLVARLWDEWGAALPEDCRVVFYGAPALMHPATGVVFGFAGGTHTIALRLPEPQRADALRAGALRLLQYPGRQPAFDLDTIGPEWVFCRWRPDEIAWCQGAFAFAAEGSSHAPPASAA